ncbi:hypothetical protein D3C71_2160960 [compost metagenome]
MLCQSGFALGNVAAAIEDLTLQIGDVQPIVIGQQQGADAGGGQIKRGGGA